MRFIRMTTERFTHALSRLEAAAARLEALTVQSTPSGAAADADLAMRHERLRAGTMDALARLDRLIAAQGAGKA
jgi:hypothetical protein